MKVRGKLPALAGALLVASAVVTPSAAVAEQQHGGIQNTRIRMFNTEPFRPLLPGDTNEWGGGRLISMMFTGLVGYWAFYPLTRTRC